MQGVKPGNAKIERIRQSYLDGDTQASIAKKESVSTFTIAKYVKGLRPEDNGDNELPTPQAVDTILADTTEGKDDISATSSKKSAQRQTVSRPATSIEEANTVVVNPRRFEMSSLLLWQAKLATEREWGWPVYPPGDWLDTFLFNAFKKFGIVLGGYVVVKDEEDKHASAKPV